MIKPESYLAIDWPVPKNIGAAFTTRLGGVSRNDYESFNLALHVGDSEADVLQNRRQLERDQQIDSVQWLNQVHGIDAIEIKEKSDVLTTADASYTRAPGIACSVLVADCMPVIVADKKGNCVGVAHAGWRGLCSGVIPNLITKMQLEPEQALVWLGPCIGPEFFEVGPEVLEAFKSSTSFHSLDVEAAFRPGDDDRYFADLPKLAELQLHALGIQGVYSGTECTYGNPDKYFSYRRDGVTGRMAALIWIKNS